MSLPSSSPAFIIKRLGHVLTFVLVLTMFCIRYLLYSAVTNPWMFLLIELLHGLSFSVFYPNMMSYAASMSPKGAQATVQGTVKSIFTAGSAIGGFMGGALIDTIGGSSMLGYLGSFLGAYTLVFSGVQYLMHRCLPEEDVPDRAGYEPIGDDDEDTIHEGLDFPPVNLPREDSASRPLLRE